MRVYTRRLGRCGSVRSRAAGRVTLRHALPDILNPILSSTFLGLVSVSIIVNHTHPSSPCFQPLPYCLLHEISRESTALPLLRLYFTPPLVPCDLSVILSVHRSSPVQPLSHHHSKFRRRTQRACRPPVPLHNQLFRSHPHHSLYVFFLEFMFLVYNTFPSTLLLSLSDTWFLVPRHLLFDPSQAAAYL
ncbi:hypothetical protein FPV67DRAFT_290149 [Lyophyllum atratum]|nr:hypothetical protein FPV67DRAFT_290149 [Lyophyllum atratum]